MMIMQKENIVTDSGHYHIAQDAYIIIDLVFAELRKASEYHDGAHSVMLFPSLTLDDMSPSVALIYFLSIILTEFVVMNMHVKYALVPLTVAVFCDVLLRNLTLIEKASGGDRH